VRLLTGTGLFVAGAALGGAVAFPWVTVWLFLASASLTLAWATVARRSPLFPLAALVFLAGLALAGAADSSQPEPQGVPAAGVVTFEGVLADNPRAAGDAVRLRVRADTLISDEGTTAVDFEVDVFASRLISGRSGESVDPDAVTRRPVLGFQRGDRYLVEGRFKPTGPGGTVVGTVSAGRVVLLAGPFTGPMAAVGGWRAELIDSTARVLPEPVASLGTGLVAGDRTRIAPDIVDAFRGSGTAHVLAVSGLHVGMTGMLALAAAAFVLGRRRQAYLLVPLGAIWVYAALAGFAAPVTRSAIMMSVFLLGRALGRQHSVAPSLGAAAAVMVAIDPGILREASFQLSFSAVAGIALLARPFMRCASALVARLALFDTTVERAVHAASAGAAVCAAATAATAPLVLLYFDALPVWGVPATLAMLPALPVVIVSSALGGVLGLVSNTAGEVAAWPAWLCGRYVIEVARFFAGLPPGPLAVAGWGAIAAVAYYAAVVVFFGRREIVRAGSALVSAGNTVAAWVGRAAARGRPAPWWLVGGAAALATLAGVGAAGLPESTLRLTVFEMEQGDMFLVETPGGNRALIDGGASPLGAVRMLGQKLPFWDRSLDLVALTHAHADHVGGLQAVMDRYEVDLVLDAPSEHDSDLYQEWLEGLPRPGESPAQTDGERLRRVSAEPGQVILLDQGVTLEVLSAFRQDPGTPPGDLNDTSLVMRLRYGEVAMLLAGDLTSEGERRLLRERTDLSAQVLKVGHQGSRDSSSPTFLKAVSPLIAVIPAGTDNPYGHPHAETLLRLEERVCPGCVLVTKDRGDVTVVTDGTRLWVETER